MILQALAEYYNRLEQDPETDIAPYGFSRQKIGFCVVLNEDGSLHEIQDVRRQDGKRLVSLPLIVPGGAKAAGSGINPGFLWDNPAYMLGFKPDDKKPARTRKSFEAFRDRHLGLAEEIDAPEFTAVCRFLEAWNPSDAKSDDTLEATNNTFGVFRIRGQRHFLHDVKRVVEWWQEQIESEGGNDAVFGQCLVTGENGPLARIHEPQIKGVRGAQSAGGTIVSFNCDSFESYRKEQSYNAPVGERAAFQYCTAINNLLSSRRQRIQIGDATTVFWTARPTPAESCFGHFFDIKSAEDDALKTEVMGLLRRISAGEYPVELGEPQTAFYVLGLSPNAARISIRFWYVSTLEEAIAKLKEHFDDLTIIAPADRETAFPALWQLLRETARESKDIAPLLSGTLMRAVLAGTPYPAALYNAVLRRIRADREVRYLRAAIIKAYLNRNTRFGVQPLKKEIDMALDPDRPEPSYHMGRLFAELEKAQEDALTGINDTIKDRYFGAASATPASVFPRLIRLSQHHLAKLEKGSRVYHERRIQEITGRLEGFPSHLGLREQGMFAIGYYHQRQDIFTKKPQSERNQEKE